MKKRSLITLLVSLAFTACTVCALAACGSDEKKPVTYTVTYSLGDYDGTGTAPASQTAEENTKITLPAVGVTWTDHTFLGWKDSADGNALAAGTEYTVTADVTFTASWRDDTPLTPPADLTNTVWVGTDEEDIDYELSFDGTSVTFTVAGEPHTGTVSSYVLDADGNGILTVSFGEDNDFTFGYVAETSTVYYLVAGEPIAELTPKTEGITLPTGIDGTWTATEDGETSTLVFDGLDVTYATSAGTAHGTVTAYDAATNKITVSILSGSDLELTYDAAAGTLTDQWECVYTKPAPITLPAELVGTWTATDAGETVTLVFDGLDITYMTSGGTSNGTVTAYDDTTHTLTVTVSGMTDKTFVFDPDAKTLSETFDEGDPLVFRPATALDLSDFVGTWIDTSEGYYKVVVTADTLTYYEGEDSFVGSELSIDSDGILHFTYVEVLLGDETTYHYGLAIKDATTLTLLNLDYEGSSHGYLDIEDLALNGSGGDVGEVTLPSELIDTWVGGDEDYPISVVIGEDSATITVSTVSMDGTYDSYDSETGALVIDVDGDKYNFTYNAAADTLTYHPTADDDAEDDVVLVKGFLLPAGLTDFEWAGTDSEGNSYELSFDGKSVTFAMAGMSQTGTVTSYTVDEFGNGTFTVMFEGDNEFTFGYTEELEEVYYLYDGEPMATLTHKMGGDLGLPAELDGIWTGTDSGETFTLVFEGINVTYTTSGGTMHGTVTAYDAATNQITVGNFGGIADLKLTYDAKAGTLTDQWDCVYTKSSESIIPEGLNGVWKANDNGTQLELTIDGETATYSVDGDSSPAQIKDYDPDTNTFTLDVSGAQSHTFTYDEQAGSLTDNWDCVFTKDGSDVGGGGDGEYTVYTFVGSYYTFSGSISKIVIDTTTNTITVDDKTPFVAEYTDGVWTLPKAQIKVATLYVKISEDKKTLELYDSADCSAESLCATFDFSAGN